MERLAICKRHLSSSLLVVALLSAFYVQYHFVAMHSVPTGDEGHFIELADNILKGRGYVTRVKHHFYPFNDSVEHPDDTRQPVVPYLFAALFTLTGVSYQASKLFLVCINLLNAVLIFIIGNKVFDEKVALVSAAFVGFYPTQIFSWTGIVQSSEPVFVSLFLIAVSLTVRTSKTGMAWLAIGALCGLLYLTRANGLWLVLPLGLHMYFVRNELDSKKVLLVAAAFLAVCLPWFIRNYRLFGNPIYTSAQHNYWLDSYWLFHAYLDYVPTFAHYVKTHSLMQMIERGGSGLYITLRDFFLVTWSFTASMPFFVYALLYRDQFGRFSFFYLSILVTILGVSWYAPAYAVGRFLVPFHPLMILWSMGGVFECGRAFCASPRSGGVSRLKAKYVFIAATLAILFFPQLKMIVDDYGTNDFERAGDLKQLSEWVREGTSEDATIMVSPFDRLHQLVFEYDRRTVIIPNNDFRTIFSIARKHGVDYIVISRELLRDSEKGFYRFWANTPGGIKEKAAMENLRLVYEHDDGSYLIYRIL